MFSSDFKLSFLFTSVVIITSQSCGTVALECIVARLSLFWLHTTFWNKTNKQITFPFISDKELFIMSKSINVKLETYIHRWCTSQLVWRLQAPTWVLACLPWQVNLWKKGFRASTFYFALARMGNLIFETFYTFLYRKWLKYLVICKQWNTKRKWFSNH